MSTLSAAPTARPLSLRVNFSWTFAGNVAYALSQWGMVMVLAKLGSPVMVGMYGFGIAVASPILAVAMLQLRSVQVTDARGEYPFADYFGTRILGMLLGFAVIVGVALVATNSATAFWVAVLVGLAKTLESLSDIVRGLFQRHERMDYSGLSLVLKGPVSLLVMAGLLWWTGDFVTAVASVPIVYAITFVLYDLLEARSVLGMTGQPQSDFRRLRPRFDARTILRLSWLAFPLGIVMGLITLQIQIPRLVLEGFAGIAALGYFVAVVYPMQAGQLVITALGQSAAPRLSRYYLENRDAYRKLLSKLLLVSGALAAGIVIGVLLVGEAALRLLYGPEYAQYHVEFLIIAIAAALQLFSSAWGYALTSARRFNLQVVLTASTCLATTIASFILVPKWGIRGAAVAVLITSVVTAILFFIAVRAVIRAPAPPIEVPEPPAASELQGDAHAAAEYT